MHKRLYDFFGSQQNIRSSSVSLQEKKHSTSHNTLISMNEKIRNTINNGNYGRAIFIDLKKAFDTVNHSICYESWITMASEALYMNGLCLIFPMENSMFQLMDMHLMNL